VRAVKRHHDGVAILKALLISLARALRGLNVWRRNRRDLVSASLGQFDKFGSGLEPLANVAPLGETLVELELLGFVPREDPANYKRIWRAALQVVQALIGMLRVADLDWPTVLALDEVDEFETSAVDWISNLGWVYHWRVGLNRTKRCRTEPRKRLLLR
jgi:hypothetical protein